jgi:glucose/arabinose dehydrogenase
VAGLPAVWERQDGGLFDVEVHPKYRSNGWIYLSYSEPGPNNTSMTAIVRGRLKDHRWVDQQFVFHAKPELYTDSIIHYGSRFLFDKSGKLYYSIGDRGVLENAQDLSKPAGKVHRINDDGSIPKDNPFVKRAGALPSIWTYGHRNPQGLAFDPAGKLWESEHGPRGGDELNRLEPGRNYGWGVISHGAQPGITLTAQEGMEQPVAFWTPAIGPSSIVFYTGARYPRWRNNLFLAALGGQRLLRLEVAGDKVTRQEAVFTEFGRVRDIVTGPDGYFYIALQLPGARLSDSTQGLIVRLVPVE